jgi:hypothetical protein
MIEIKEYVGSTPKQVKEIKDLVKNAKKSNTNKTKDNTTKKSK